MSESIHGHEIKKMAKESGIKYTRESLKTAIDEKFGSDAIFHSCSADNMTADQMIEFFEKKGKFNLPDYTFATGPQHECH